MDQLFSFIEDSFENLLNHFLLTSSLLLLIEEGGIPLPIPGDVIISYIGYQASLGKISYISAFLALLFSILIGASFLYFLSYRYGEIILLKLGRFIDLDEEKLEKIEKWFKKYGIWVIIFGRHIPGFRIAITIFSGISKVSYPTFIVGTLISSIAWIGFFLFIGAKLGSKSVGLLHNHQGFFLLLIVPSILFFLILAFLRKGKSAK